MEDLAVQSKNVDHELSCHLALEPWSFTVPESCLGNFLLSFVSRLFRFMRSENNALTDSQIHSGYLWSGTQEIGVEWVEVRQKFPEIRLGHSPKHASTTHHCPNLRSQPSSATSWRCWTPLLCHTIKSTRSMPTSMCRLLTCSHKKGVSTFQLVLFIFSLFFVWNHGHYCT